MILLRVLTTITIFLLLLNLSVFIQYAHSKTNSANDSIDNYKSHAVDTDADETENEDEGDDWDNEEERETIFSCNGYIEFENFVNTYKEQEPQESNKKNEFRLNLNLKYGTEDFFIKTIPNFYLLPLITYNEKSIYHDYVYEDNFLISRNGRISARNYEISFNESYVNYEISMFRIRAGNQIYGWGTADVSNPTSYFNPADLRELILKGEDEGIVGIPSLSTMIFLDDLSLDNFSLELVYVPVHIPAIAPVPENYWSYHYKEGPLTISQNELEPLEIAPENFGYGGRFSGSLSGYDFSLSGYKGPDKDPVLRPMGTLLTDDVPVLIKPEYHLYTIAGFDFSFKIDNFVFQGEATYSPDKWGVVKQDYSVNMAWPFVIKKSPYYSYATGFNYIYSDTVFTFEWNQAKYFDTLLIQPTLTKFIVTQIESAFFDDRLLLSTSFVWDIINKGYLLWPALEIDIQNGLKFNISYGIVNGSGDSMDYFTLFDNYDIILFSVKYEF